jgi:hypothetical protein
VQVRYDLQASATRSIEERAQVSARNAECDVDVLAKQALDECLGGGDGGGLGRSHTSDPPLEVVPKFIMASIALSRVRLSNRRPALPVGVLDGFAAEIAEHKR